MWHSNSACPMSVLNLISTMEQASLLHCHDCKNNKTKDQFILRKRNNKYGVRGEPDRTTYNQHFTALLHEQAIMGVTSSFARSSTQRLAGEADETCTGIVGRVWEATGFRFTYDQFPLEEQWLMLPLFNQIQDEKCPEERHRPTTVRMLPNDSQHQQSREEAQDGA